MRVPSYRGEQYGVLWQVTDYILDSRGQQTSREKSRHIPGMCVNICTILSCICIPSFTAIFLNLMFFKELYACQLSERALALPVMILQMT